MFALICAVRPLSSYCCIFTTYCIICLSISVSKLPSVLVFLVSAKCLRKASCCSPTVYETVLFLLEHQSLSSELHTVLFPPKATPYTLKKLECCLVPLTKACFVFKSAILLWKLRHLSSVCASCEHSLFPVAFSIWFRLAPRIKVRPL